MHIVQVDIDNFKSFSRKTSIPFFEGYTVVSGPNGSGKSNIIDAILFVLSLSSSRNLRADNMSDFINTMSGKNTAEVTLEFSDGTRIRRKIKQTPSSVYSYYYMNDKTSSQAEILDFLAKNGIRPHGYNVVMQGDLNRIMSMSDRERRGIIDSIAGVAEFDVKKDQALEELDQVRAKIEREELLLEEYTKQLADLSAAREDAVKWVKLNKDLEYFNAAKKFADIRKLETELLTIATSRQDQEVLRSNHEERMHVLEKERDAHKAEVSRLDKRITEKQGPEYMKIVSGQEEQKGIIRSSEETILLRNKDKEQVRATMNQLYGEIQKFQNSYNDKTSAVQKLQIDRVNLAMELENQKKVLLKAQNLVSKRDMDSKGANQELVELMAKISAKKDERDSLYVQRDGIVEKSRIRQSELDKYNREAEALKIERIELTREQDELGKSLGSAQDEQKVIVKQIAEAERKMMNVKKNLDSTRQEITRLKLRQAKLEGEQRASGASDRAIDAISNFEGVYGTVAKLGKVLKAEHTVALNIAAGGRLKNVIVDTDQTGADCIRYLKEEAMGRLTFLPLNKMKEGQPLPPLAGNGVIDYAINLIDFKPEYRQAFNLVFGQTVVVANMDAGRRLMGRYRMVTLDGDLLEKAGSMTGGSINKDMRGFGVSTGNESAELSAKIAELMAEEDELVAADKRHETIAGGTYADASADFTVGTPK
ncbi:MAG TPA: AAA family ATPase, partial [Methanocorpusculum sp.]|nr:AAA family ATPase [Methanocorpusculum sp.]